MSPTLVRLLEINLAASTLLMLGAYVLSSKLIFYSIVDIAWAYGFLIVTGITTVLAQRTPSLWILSVMVGLWSVRLGTHLLTRIKSHYPKEDGRYAELLADWEKTANWKFLIFFLIQGLSVVFMSLPVLLVAQDSSPSVSFLQKVATVLWLVAWTGESVADRQLSQFKTKSKGSNQVCDIGLWRYSRHPNYFFEWLIWCSFALFALSAPHGALALTAPATIFYLLFKVTGIPATEAQSLRSKKEAYVKYQQTTSVFIPWFRRKEVSDAGRKTA